MLIIDSVSKTFGGHSRPALRGINLLIPSGEFCIMIGHNGSGKSTLFQAIVKSCQIDCGTIETSGRIAMVAQSIEHNTVANMTLMEHIALSIMQHNKPMMAPYRRYRQRVVDILQRLNLGLERMLDEPLNNMSGGQRQLIATIAAVNSGCSVILLDEHTSALDPNMQKVVIEYTAKAIREMRLTAIMITHKISDAITYGDRLITMRDGAITHDYQGEAKRRLTEEAILTTLSGQHGNIFQEETSCLY